MKTRLPQLQQMITPTPKSVLIIVAHPYDETLWAGGTILSQPTWTCFVLSLYRGSDRDSAPKFHNALKILNSTGIIDDLNEGSEQEPLDIIKAESKILYLLPKWHFDLIITHAPTGEYSKHIKHEEVSKAAINLWNTGKVSANELWTFAYENGNEQYYPRPIETAPIYHKLMNRTWLRKQSIITDTYGFKQNSWEAKTTPKAETFWQYKNPEEVEMRINQPAQQLTKPPIYQPINTPSLPSLLDWQPKEISYTEN